MSLSDREPTESPVRFEFELAGTDIERLVVVAGDLEFLRSLPRDRLPSHTEVRMAAGVLRRLLGDNGGQLFRVWRLIDPEQVAPLTVEAIDLSAFLTSAPTSGSSTCGQVARSSISLATRDLRSVSCRAPRLSPMGRRRSSSRPDACLPSRNAPDLGSRGGWATQPPRSKHRMACEESAAILLSSTSLTGRGGVQFDPLRELPVEAKGENEPTRTSFSSTGSSASAT